MCGAPRRVRGQHKITKNSLYYRFQFTVIAFTAQQRTHERRKKKRIKTDTRVLIVYDVYACLHIKIETVPFGWIRQQKRIRTHSRSNQQSKVKTNERTIEYERNKNQGHFNFSPLSTRWETIPKHKFLLFFFSIFFFLNMCRDYHKFFLRIWFLVSWLEYCIIKIKICEPVDVSTSHTNPTSCILLCRW